MNSRKESKSLKTLSHNRSTAGIWLKRTGLALLGLLLGLAALIAGFLLTLDEADYQDVLAWSADYFLDSELVITGPLSIGYSEAIMFSAQGVQLQAHDGSYSLEANHYQLVFSTT